MEDKILESVIKILLDNKAIDVCYLNITSVNPLCEYYIICSASSNRQAMALARYVDDTLAKNNVEVKHIEGNDNSEWILVDGTDYVVHIFVNEARDKYSLEKMWSTLPIYKVG